MSSPPRASEVLVGISFSGFDIWVNWFREEKSPAWTSGLPPGRTVHKIRFFKLCFVSCRSQWSFDQISVVFWRFWYGRKVECSPENAFDSALQFGLIFLEKIYIFHGSTAAVESCSSDSLMCLHWTSGVWDSAWATDSADPAAACAHTWKPVETGCAHIDGEVQYPFLLVVGALFVEIFTDSLRKKKAFEPRLLWVPWPKIFSCYN